MRAIGPTPDSVWASGTRSPATFSPPERRRTPRAALRKLIRDEPRFIPAHVRLGDALRALGVPNEAVDAWYHGFETTGSPIF